MLEIPEGLPRVVHHAAVRAELPGGARGLDAAGHEGLLVLREETNRQR